MLKLLSSVFVGLVCSAVFAAAPLKEVKLSDPVVIDDFNDAYDDDANQNTLGAVYGSYSLGGFWLGGGYWYFFNDAGSTVKNSAGEVLGLGLEKTMIPDSSLHVKITTSTSTETIIYAGVGCNLVVANEYVDLSKMTGLSLRAKGTDSVRVSFETKDIVDLGEGWGFYGKVIKLNPTWTTHNIPIAELVPEQWSKPEKSKWTFAVNGSKAVTKLAFKVKDKQDCELYIDDIIIQGMTYEDFGWSPAVPVVISKTKKTSDVFSVSSSTLSFKLKQSQDLKVSITDIRGQKVRTLFSGKTPGETFSLSNLNLSSGRYLAVISGKNINYTQAIIITK